MSVADFGTYRSARLLIRVHGEAAPLEVAKVVHALLSAGDVEGQRIWLGILAAVDQLQAKEPLPPATVH